MLVSVVLGIVLAPVALASYVVIVLLNITIMVIQFLLKLPIMAFFVTILLFGKVAEVADTYRTAKRRERADPAG